MARTNEGSYSFLEFTLDLSTERLYRGSEEIRLRPKSFQVMLYLIEHRRLVTRDELLQAVWGDVVVTDESISKCIAEIRKALGDESQEIVRTVTKRGFLFEPQVRLVQPAPQPAEAAAPVTARTFPWNRAMVAAGVTVAGLALLVPILLRARLSGRKPVFEAIAVLPFESLSTSPDQQYVADGMTEAVITSLGETSPLRVIARTSVNQYVKTKKPIREIAAELKVDALVEGTIAQSGNHLRVTANLIQVSPERHIWAHSYEREIRDALALEGEIASAIASEIQGKLVSQKVLPLTGGHPVNEGVQLAYWRAKYVLNNTRGDAAEFYHIIESSEQAHRIDPGYAPAYATEARAYDFLNDIEALPSKESTSHARAAAQRAVALDEHFPFAHVALGQVLLIRDWNWAKAEREARRAIELNPSDADAHNLLSNYLAAVGRTEEAVAEMKRARELDPLSLYMNWNVGRILCLARRYDEALDELRQAGAMQRNNPAVDIWLFKSLSMKGQPDEAIATDLRLRGYREGLKGESLDALRVAYAKSGTRGYWAKLRDLVLPIHSSHPIGWYRLAEINTYLGDKEEAFRWLEKAFEERPNWIPFIKVDPTLDPLRSDPRFTAFLQRMGLTP